MRPSLKQVLAYISCILTALIYGDALVNILLVHTDLTVFHWRTIITLIVVPIPICMVTAWAFDSIRNWNLCLKL